LQLENMRRPFGFMEAYYAQEKILQEGPAPASQRAEAMRQFEELQARAEVVEKQAKVKFDELSSQVAERIGLREVPWFKLTIILTALYALVTILGML
jgi:hypothetical protein